MAKRKAAELSPEAQAANAAGETRRAKEKQARARNAEKQKRFRDGMKEAGYKRVTLWDDPAPAGQHKRMTDRGLRQVPAWENAQDAPGKSRAAMIKVAVRIHETSLHTAGKFPKIREALKSAAGGLALALGDAPEEKAIYNDFLELVKVLGDPWEE